MPRKRKATRKTFPEIDPVCFQHPADREQLKKLARLPAMKILLRRVSGDYLEKSLRMLNVAERVRVTPRQCPKIYELFRLSCEVLDVRELPEIYLSTSYTPNAFSFGIRKYSVVLHSGLIDLLTEEELLFIIGHELSHIKCNHMMYKTILYLLSYVGVEVFGIVFKLASITFLPLQMALRSWERKAEFSCDRGGLLVVQNRDVAQTALVKLAGYSKNLLQEINTDEILKQADELKGMDEELFIRAMKIYHTAFRSHPFPIIRFKELRNWSESNSYSRILNGEYPRENGKR